MNLKNKNFTFLEVKDKETIEKIFSFRYEIITNTEIFQEYVKHTTFKNNKETDKYDAYSEHFAVLDKNAEICATVRLIHHSPYDYPTESSMKFDNSNFSRDNLGEISRIFIAPKYRKTKLTKLFIHKLNELLYAKMIALNIKYTYGALEPRFIRLLKMNQMNYEILGPLQPQGDMGLRHPCVLYTQNLGQTNPEFHQSEKQ